MQIAQDLVVGQYAVEICRGETFHWLFFWFVLGVCWPNANRKAMCSHLRKYMPVIVQIGINLGLTCGNGRRLLPI
jgi:hypothetical protein